jgi:hypothetical protein
MQIEHQGLVIGCVGKFNMPLRIGRAAGGAVGDGALSRQQNQRGGKYELLRNRSFV